MKIFESANRVGVVLFCFLIGTTVFGGFFASFSSVQAEASAIFTVNSPLDARDALLGDGLCADAEGNCTLRAAIQEANRTSTADTILLPSGLYTLTIPGQEEDNATTGDLDITNPLVISGTGPTAPIVDGNNLDRVFHILTDVTVEIIGLTIQHGYAGDEKKGGGVYNDGFFILSHSTITDNLATGFKGEGGGIYSSGPMWLLNSTVADNRTTGQEGYGGGIRSAAPLTVENSLILNNATTGIYGSGGGMYTNVRLVIRNSRISGNTTDAWNADGGGLFIHRNPTTIISSTFDHNGVGVSPGGATNGRGAGIYQFGDAPTPHMTILDSAFIANFADGNGAGLFAWGFVNITRTVFISNVVVNGSGGAIVAMYKKVNIWDSTFMYNSSLNGGAIHIRNNGILMVENSTITDNKGQNLGGGVDVSGSATIRNSVISRNSGFYGGGIYIISGALAVENSTLSNNIANGWGGGLYIGTSTNVSNTTISGNTAKYDGGGISTRASGITHLYNVTVVHNTADSDSNNNGNGGGVYAYNGNVHLYNTIIAQNNDLSADIRHPDCSETILSYGYSLVGDNTGCAFTPAVGDQIGTGSNPIDPLLGPLQDNGGPTFTHSPRLDSPAMDAGNPAAPGSGGTACTAADQRGAIRPLDGNSDGDPVCDIGAVEGDTPILSLTASNDSPTTLGDLTTLTAATSGGMNVSYQWNLGDGTLGEGEVITHLYPTAGVYTAVVTATNSVGQLTTTTLVVVESPTTTPYLIYLPGIFKAQNQSR